jgi:hypothetical protein
MKLHSFATSTLVGARAKVTDLPLASASQPKAAGLMDRGTQSLHNIHASMMNQLE